MSASTVSITANPSTATRRRAVEKRPIDFADANNISAAAAEVVDNARLAVRGASVRAEATREAVVQVKKPLQNGAVGQPRASNAARKPGSKPEKPRWKTVISIFLKNFILLAFLLACVLLVKEFMVRNGKWGGFSEEVAMPLGTSDGEMHKFVESMAKTVKMMQVQVDVIDKKIGQEVERVRGEVNEKLEGKSVELEEKLKVLDGRTVSLEKFTGELGERMEKWLSKGDLNEFLEEFKKREGKNVVNLDDIRAFARSVVEREIEKHAADGVGRVDYALASGGATVVRHSEPFAGGKGIGNGFLSFKNRIGVHNDADKMLRPSFGEPGQCFALKGRRGFVQIRLRTAILLEAITLEHVAESVAYDRSSAPKNCRISGWLQRQELTDPMANSERMFLLTEFTYNLENSNVQTFSVVDSARSNIVDTIRFDFTSNHGSPTHTCIYRLRVHGQEPNSVSMLTAES